PGNAGGRARLDLRGADLPPAYHQEHRGETVHALLEQGLDRLRRHVAPGEAAAAGGDDDVDCGIGDPLSTPRTDFLHDIDHDGTAGDRVAGLFGALDQCRAGPVVGEGARVGDRQHRDLQRYELPAVVDSGHDAPFTQ